MYVYRFLNKKNEIIYVGRSKDISKRISTHSHLPNECYEEVNYIEYIALNNDDESAIYERYYINIFNPKYNTQYKNKSEFSFKLPNYNWKKYDGNVSKENWVGVKLKYNLPNLTDADLGKFYKLLLNTTINNNIIYTKLDIRSKPMNKYDIMKILNIEVKATERFTKRLKDLEILKYNEDKCFYTINTDFIDVEKDMS